MTRRSLLALFVGGLVLAGCGGGGGGGGGSRIGGGSTNPDRPLITRIEPDKILVNAAASSEFRVFVNGMTRQQGLEAFVFIGTAGQGPLLLQNNDPAKGGASKSWFFEFRGRTPPVEERDKPIQARVVFADGTEADQANPPVTMTWFTTSPAANP